MCCLYTRYMLTARGSHNSHHQKPEPESYDELRRKDTLREIRPWKKNVLHPKKDMFHLPTSDFQGRTLNETKNTLFGFARKKLAASVRTSPTNVRRLPHLQLSWRNIIWPSMDWIQIMRDWVWLFNFVLWPKFDDCLKFLCSMHGKTDPKLFSKMVGFDGDEFNVTIR